MDLRSNPLQSSPKRSLIGPCIPTDALPSVRVIHAAEYQEGTDFGPEHSQVSQDRFADYSTLVVRKSLRFIYQLLVVDLYLHSKLKKMQ